MPRHARRSLPAAAMALFVALPAAAPALQTDTGTMRVEKVAEGFGTPWSIAFLPGGDVLVTEKEGRLWRIGGGDSVRIEGLPDLRVTGQGGLLDVLVPRDFAQSRQIYLTHAKRQRGGAGTALSVGRLSEDGARLENVETIFEMEPGSSGGRHFGSRLAEGPDGLLYMSIGERGDRQAAQDLSLHNGSILRLTREGEPAPGNPFLGDEGSLPEIWSYGHRNPQGLAFDGQGQLWDSEHGARGGDEVNRIRKGANYGWPEVSYGTHYSGRDFAAEEREGIVGPVHYWDPSMAPSGLTFHSGRGHRPWAGNAFVGSLKFDYISRLAGDPLTEVERIEGPETQRIRDVREGPDGALWFIAEDLGAVFRIRPE